MTPLFLTWFVSLEWKNSPARSISDRCVWRHTSDCGSESRIGVPLGWRLEKAARRRREKGFVRNGQTKVWCGSYEWWRFSGHWRLARGSDFERRRFYFESSNVPWRHAARTSVLRFCRQRSLLTKMQKRSSTSESRVFVVSSTTSVEFSVNVILKCAEFGRISFPR